MDINVLNETDLFASFIEQSETVFNIKDLDGRYIYANQQTRSYFSDPTADYKNKTDFDFFPPEIAQRFREADLKVITTKEKIVLEEYVNLGNRIATHLSVKFPILAPSGDVIATGMYTVDITQRKHKEEQHLSALQKYQHLITALGEITYEYHAPTQHMTWSGRYQQILGYRPDEIGQHQSDWISRIHPEDLEYVKQGIKQAQHSEQIFDLEYRFRHKDGTYLWMHGRGVITLNEYGEILDIIGVMQDITQQKHHLEDNEQLQRQVLQIQKMDALGQLTGGIAHDFNNILSAIRGYTELSRSQIKTPQAITNIEKYLNEVTVATDRAAQLVQQMLAFSRGKTGTPQIITPESGIHDAIRLLHSMIPSSVKLAFTLKHHHRHIKIDPINLQQLLINLIVNARDAIQDQTGKIEIILADRPASKVTCASCHEDIRTKMIAITVKDNGEGIANSEIMNRMFDPFFTTKADRKGNGMGLSVVHGIMHSCGGHILVNSIPGKETCIELLFPECLEIPEQHKVTASVQPLPHRTHQRKHDNSYIMVVDDEVAITSLLTEMLQKNGFRVRSFNDPTRALAAFEDSVENCNLIILDQTMPELTGDKLAQKILGIRHDIPILMCCGYSDLIDKDRAKNIGIREYLEKPFNKDQLLRTIFQLLREKTALSS